MHSFCVVLRPQRFLTSAFQRTKRYYLKANTAAQAMLVASEDPNFIVVGVEPAGLAARNHMGAHIGAGSAVTQDSHVA
jgi:hypothetical protein